MSDRTSPNSYECAGPADDREDLSRRGFLQSLRNQAIGLGAASAAAAWISGDAVAAAGSSPGDILGASPGKRRQLALARRAKDAQLRIAKQKLPKHEANGDEKRYANYIANFTKGLPHDDAGEVDPTAYERLLKALNSGDLGDLELVPAGCPPGDQRPWVNPLGGLTYDGLGYDGPQLLQPPAPLFASAEQASEGVELYWMAHLRDVHFADYGSDALAGQAQAELAAMAGYQGPTTLANLFRLNLPQALVGPYVSQFLIRAIPWGAVYTDARVRTKAPGDDHATTFSEWLRLQKGCKPAASPAWDSTPRFIRNGRDLAEWVHNDPLIQGFVQAALILATPEDPTDPFTGGGLGAPRSTTNPYSSSFKQMGFGSFGDPWITAVVVEAAIRALRTVWYQKWFVHRRLRPEVYGGRIHRVVAAGASYPVHTQALNSQAVARAFTQFGTYLLPQAFPEGSPLHPSYGAGHATVSGACATVLKAIFQESHPISNPKVASADGTTLVNYVGSDAGQMTVGGELNKLASNIAQGRNFAGIHWRSDSHASLRLGEKVAIGLLASLKQMSAEEFDGFTFTSFDGETVVI